MQEKGSEEVAQPGQVQAKASTPVKGSKMPFGHHSGKMGQHFCTMEGMGQVSASFPAL